MVKQSEALFELTRNSSRIGELISDTPYGEKILRFFFIFNGESWMADMDIHGAGLHKKNNQWLLYPIFHKSDGVDRVKSGPEKDSWEHSRAKGINLFNFLIGIRRKLRER